MKFAKVRITDNRPPGAGKPSPLERKPARPEAAARPALRTSPPMTGMDHWNRIEALMAREHDATVASYSGETAEAALSDLAPRKGSSKDPEFRWIRHRRAALARKLHAPELIRK